MFHLFFLILTCQFAFQTSYANELKTPEQAEIVISYFSRPPYYETKGEHAGGLLVEKAREVLTKAKINHRFVEMSLDRILVEIRFSRKPICSIGWLQNSERDGFAVFSKPFFKNSPYVLLTRATEANKLSKHKLFSDVLKDKNLVLGIARGFSYGLFVDEALKTHQPTVIDSEPLHHNLPLMLSRGRFSYMIVDEEEVDDLLASAKLDKKAFTIVKLKDLPQREPRRIMCSKSTPAEVLSKIDKALEGSKL